MRRALFTRTLLAFCFCFAMSATSINAATLTVTKTADTKDGVCDADCSLREAIMIAAPGDTIRFSAPLFDTQQTIALALDLGDLAVGRSLTITGKGANLLSIRPASDSAMFRIFNVNGAGVVVTLSGMTLTGAKASGGSGGGINNNGGISLTLHRVHVTDNSARAAARVGGGIHNTADSTLTVTDSTISNNTATSTVGDSGGGGIYNEGALNISNSTVSGNSKTDDGGSNDGGGIWTSGATVITNSTVTDNAADGASSAGGIHRAGTTGSVTIRNSIIAANRNNSSKPDVSGVFISAGYNLIGNPGGTTNFTQPGDQNGTSNEPRNPLLNSLAGNGGATPTHALNLASPAIDAGKSFGAMTDGRGFMRSVNNPNIANAAGGDASDIGAYEAGYSSLTPSADAYVVGADASRNTNYGAGVEMQVKRTLNPGSGRGRRGFLRFDTSAIAGDITRARLRIFARLTDASLPATGMIIQKVTGTAWDELALTWNLQPQVAAPDPLAQVTVTGATGAWYEFDITAFLQQERAAGRTLVSFRLINQQATGTSGASFTSINSKEATSNQPQLVIEQ